MTSALEHYLAENRCIATRYRREADVMFPLALVIGVLAGLALYLMERCNALG